MVPNVPIIEIADDHVPVQNPEPETDEESSASGDSAQDTREMYEALDSLNMLPLSNAMPISVVFPTAPAASSSQQQTKTNLKTTAEILVQMNQGKPAEESTVNEGNNSNANAVPSSSENLVVENPSSAMVLYPQVEKLNGLFQSVRLVIR